MKQFRLPATFPDAADFHARLQEIDPTFHCHEELVGSDGALGQSLKWHGRELANRWAVHPMEGWDGTEDGLPSADTLRRWRRFGQSGAALIWGGEAFAVCPMGRANPNQLHQGSHPNVGEGLKQLMAELRAGQAEAGLAAEESWVGLQLTHSGRWSRPTADGPAPRTMMRHEFLDEKIGIQDDSALLSDEELGNLPPAYARAAGLAEAAGFDFVDIKCCHGYLLHESLAAYDRPGPYGGSFENRTRLFREIVAAVKKACPNLAIGVRLSATDTIDKGFADADAFLALLEEMGIGMVNLTQGSPYYCPNLQRPAAFPPSDGTPPTRDPLFDVWHHLRVTRELKEAHPNLILVGTGYTYLQEFLPHVAEYEVAAGHVDFVGLGRMILSYPTLPQDHLEGIAMQRKKICRTFSDCTTAPRNGMRSGCYPLDPEYRNRPEAKVVRALRPGRKKIKGESV